MALRHRHPDLSAHEPGCTRVDAPDNSGADLNGYVEVFCDCHHYTEPRILMNGTDVAWPAGWTAREAMDWRRRNGLVPPAEVLG